MTDEDASAAPVIVFGAFDRHNFGDLLFPHVAAALLPGRELLFAGLAERDLRSCGGHHVMALAQLAAQWRGRPVNIIHAGGELLTCSAWEAAVMLSQPREAQEAIARLDAYPDQALHWAQRRLQLSALAPYTLRRALFPHAGKVLYAGVGGVDLDQRDPALRAEALDNLRTADGVGVRDARTQSLLHAAGIRSRLMPDPAAMTAELFGARISARSETGEVARIADAMQQGRHGSNGLNGYIAVQFSADFGDDATLDELAIQLEHAASFCRLGVVLFRAGSAPWHDDLGCYRRILKRMEERTLALQPPVPVKIFESLDLWDICALIARSRAYAGSSLHGRIVAMAFGLPRISLLPPPRAGQGAERPSKQAAYVATWEEPEVSGTVEVNALAAGIRGALAAEPKQLGACARSLAARYRREFDALVKGLP